MTCDGIGTDAGVAPQYRRRAAADAARGVTAGVTFIFGALKTSNETEVHDAAGTPASETIGGLSYHNYASRMGLMAGGVFWKIAEKSAARYVKQ